MYASDYLAITRRLRTMKKATKATLLMLLGLVLSAPLYADSDSTVYNYAGNELNQPGSWVNQPLCACNIMGEMTFAQPLNLPTDIQDTTGTPTSYSFTVDGYTLDQTNSTIQSFAISQLTWGLDILGQNGLTISIICQDGCGDDGGATDWAGFGGNTIGEAVGDPGKWTATVPEPATHFALLSGIAGLIIFRMYVKRRIQ
jgi:hypothetical protein